MKNMKTMIMVLGTGIVLAIIGVTTINIDKDYEVYEGEVVREDVEDVKYRTTGGMFSEEKVKISTDTKEIIESRSLVKIEVVKEDKTTVEYIDRGDGTKKGIYLKVTSKDKDKYINW